MSRLIKTGDFAKLAKVNKKTLLYYDEIGLFSPAYINEKGYRFYRLYQLDRLALITVLKDLGMELKEIQKYLQSKDTGYLTELLIQKGKDIDQKMISLQKSRELLRNYQEHLDVSRYEKSVFEIKYFPRINYEEIYHWNYQSKGFIINYITDGPFTGSIVKEDQLILYRKVESGSHYFEEGQYIIRYGMKEMGVSSKEIAQQLIEFCKDHQFEIEGEIRIEYNDILIGNPNVDYYYSIVKIKS